MDKGAWWATVHGVAESWTRLKRLSMHFTLKRVCYVLHNLLFAETKAALRTVWRLGSEAVFSWFPLCNINPILSSGL